MMKEIICTHCQQHHPTCRCHQCRLQAWKQAQEKHDKNLLLRDEIERNEK